MVVHYGREYVGLQLGIDEFVADDVGKDEDGVGGLLVFGVGEVGVDCLVVR